MCRSIEVEGSPFDIGGGRYLDVRSPKVNELFFSYMPEEEWISKIIADYICGESVNR